MVITWRYFCSISAACITAFNNISSLAKAGRVGDTYFQNICLALRSVPVLSWRTCLHCYRSCHNSPIHGKNPTSRIRNIGILAHIDAGKTTTTERMLFYSGKINTMGEVHHGNTVTDYMEQERARGITITSASVSFPWKDHVFNLVDTPGHIDFTMEVEQTLSVLDGAVVVLDASAGVEAQTQTVWRQADRYNIPRIVYANKMDRQDASLVLCEQSLRDKLDAEVLTIQLPIICGNELSGLVDIIHLHKLVWPSNEGGGIKYECKPLHEKRDGNLWEMAVKAREKLVDQVSDLDDILADNVIAQENLEMISASTLSSAVRRATILKKGVPLLLGSSYKNKGVQPLMDAIVSFLPSPLERNNRLYESAFQDKLCAQAFKTMHHGQLGPLIFFRLYCGEVSKGQKIHNMRLDQTESCTRVLVATADDFEEVSLVQKGNIAVVTGLRQTRTGDMVTVSQTAASKAQDVLAKSMNISVKEAKDLLVAGARVPDPVFFCSVEAPSPTQQVALEKALAQLQREDPSLSVSYDEETAQTILGGMGELHLEIIKERIQSEFKVDILLGELQIAYKEKLVNPVHEEATTDHAFGQNKQYVKVSLTVSPEEKREILSFDSHDEDLNKALRALHPSVIKEMKRGAQAGLMYGPKLHCPLMGAHVRVHEAEVKKGTSLSVIHSTFSRCIRKALEKGETCLLEPIMQLEVVTTEDMLPSILADLSRRRASVQNIDLRPSTRVIQASVPLQELLGYANDLRTLSSGTASFSMEFLEYSVVSSDVEALIIKKEMGFSVT